MKNCMRDTGRSNDSDSCNIYSRFARVVNLALVRNIVAFLSLLRNILFRTRSMARFFPQSIILQQYITKFSAKNIHLSKSYDFFSKHIQFAETIK